ncbi:MAG TPA: hypothetical protein VD833_21370 [Vicinamibacterales bacterium]|nr:hypothetical protein [Vicinamibacterales bacterium]
MTGSNPSRLAVAVLRRFLDDNEALAGDLLEGYARRRSRVWLWRQLLGAIVIRSFEPQDEERPLGLAEQRSFQPVRRERPLVQPWRINLTASPLPGIGGLGLVALGALVALVRPEAALIFLPAIGGGLTLGVALVLVRRRGIRWGPPAARNITTAATGQ